jgi:hypothetical protein
MVAEAEHMMVMVVEVVELEVAETGELVEIVADTDELVVETE